MHPIFYQLPLHEQMHSRRVKDLSLKISKKLAIDLDDENLGIAALYHDLGKTKVPIAIVNKKGSLSTTEMEAMRLHSKWSGKILSDLNYDVNVIVPVLLHHENYDGSGYPRGIKGNRIPIESRIIRIADVWDALISKRPYKDSFSREKALRIMQEEAVYWDPDLFSILKTIV